MPRTQAVSWEAVRDITRGPRVLALGHFQLPTPCGWRGSSTRAFLGARNQGSASGLTVRRWARAPPGHALVSIETQNACAGHRPRCFDPFRPGATPGPGWCGHLA